MKVTKILIFFLLLSSQVDAQELNLLKIRKDYSIAVKDEDICENNLNILREKSKTITEKGYLSVYEMIYAKHLMNPFKKLNQFKKGKSILESLIKQDPNNVELRFIRWSVQAHAPAILNYSDNIAMDRKMMIDSLHLLKDESVKEVIYKYLKGAKSFSEAELKEIMK